MSASGEAPKTAAMAGSGETILVVEDETGVRELASEFLKAGGYNVLEARDGTDGLNFAMHYPDKIHLLLTDMVMPRMGGAELAEKLRSRRAGLRVIFMTGYSEFSGKIDEKMTGEASMLQKPFSRSTLLEKVREILSAAPSKQTSGTKL